MSCVVAFKMTLDSDDNQCSFNDTVVLYHAKKRQESQTETELTAEPDRSVGVGWKKGYFLHMMWTKGRIL